jgi:hypothetical protein
MGGQGDLSQFKRLKKCVDGAGAHGAPLYNGAAL